MKDVLRVEIKRVLGLKKFIIILGSILIFSIFTTMSSFKTYTIYDSSGRVSISSIENLKESKSDKYNIILDKDTLKDIIHRKDKSKYLYNSNLMRLILINYKDKHIEDITDIDIDNFYNERIINIKGNMSIGFTEFADYQIDNVLSRADNLEIPIKIGYSEGWKNLNNNIINIMPVILAIISTVILSLFSEDPKTNIRQLYTTTEYGKIVLVESRIIAGFLIGIIIYITSMFIFSLVTLSIFGFDGSNLSIQNSSSYFFSMYNITYFEQYLINLVIGFASIIFMTSIVLMITVIFEQILSGAVFLVFFWIIMIMSSDINFSVSHYFNNFLPYSMTNFNNYYITNEVYTIFEQIIPSCIITVVISFILSILFTYSTIIISNKKINKILK